MVEYTPSLRKLIEELKKLPGIGPKSAQRLAFHVLFSSPQTVKDLAEAMTEAKEKIKHCSTCFNISENNPCEICSDSGREDSLLCVVEEPKDLIAVERSGFKGKYHVLGGVISPLDGIGPDQLRIKELLARLKDGISEVILAMNPVTEGEATAFYLHRMIKPLGVKISRIAYGLPIGSDMDYADEATLSRAFEGRKEVL
ncbi:recombination mediator RecR [Patescibacteria group bacterium]|nr:recombination mediator RecR [Patescibacteria group bacterium]